MVPNGVAPLARRPGPTRPTCWPPGAWPARPFVLWVGSLEPRKGVGTLVAAMARLRAAGRSGRPRRPAGPGRLPRLARRRPGAAADRAALGARLHQLGPVGEEELWSLYAGASLFAFPSRHEGFGLPVLEAMSQGTAVVASDIPAIREVAGGAARLVPPDDVDRWADALEDLLGDDAEPAGRLARAGRATSPRLRRGQRPSRGIRAVYREAAGALASSVVRVLVTGSKGFVAPWLLAHLESEGDQVIGLDAEVDITDGPALTDAVTGAAPDAICHLAAQASVGASWKDQSATYAVNTFGTLNVLEAALACDRPPRVLLISSSEVYGRVTPDELPIREDHPFAPVSPYAASKAAAELVGLQAWLGRGLEVVRARPFNHTGPGQRPDFVVPALARQVAALAAAGGGVLETGNLDVRRDITDVRDVVRAYRDLLDGRRSGPGLQRVPGRVGEHRGGGPAPAGAGRGGPGDRGRPGPGPARRPARAARRSRSPARRHRLGAGDPPRRHPGRVLAVLAAAAD